MSKELDSAIDHLVNTYQSLALAAIGYANLDAKEIADRIKLTATDTPEFVALSQLAALVGEPKVNTKKEAIADSTIEQ